MDRSRRPHSFSKAYSRARGLHVGVRPSHSAVIVLLVVLRCDCRNRERWAWYYENLMGIQVHNGRLSASTNRINFSVLIGGVCGEFVRVISPHGKSTCFSVAADPDMPSAEVVASALLQLKNNPRLFKKWRKQPGSTFKANGKVFRGAYQVTKR